MNNHTWGNWVTGSTRKEKHTQSMILRIRMSFIAKYVCTCKEFVLVTEAPQCDRMTMTRRIIKTIIYKIDNVQNSTNTIYKIDSLVCTGMLGANLKFNKYVC